MPQRRQHQVQLLPVVAAFAQCRGRLDQQYVALRVLAAVRRWPQLVGEQPEGSVVAHCPGHATVFPASRLPTH
jgi:hypothetical protein